MKYLQYILILTAFLAFGQLYANDVDIAENISTSLIAGIIIGLIITVILVIAQIQKHRPVKIATCADLYVKAENVKMNTLSDKFIRRTEVVIRTTNPTPNRRR